VSAQLAEELAFAGAPVTVFSITGDGDQRRASARLFGRVCSLEFERADRDWLWVAIATENGMRHTADEYVALLREENEEGAATTLRIVNTAQQAARLRLNRYGTLDELAAHGLLLGAVGAQTARGYRVTIDVASPGYRAYATPSAYPKSGVRSFFTDDTLIVRAADRHGEAASAGDPRVD
jgi:hypothetical protein